MKITLITLLLTLHSCNNASQRQATNDSISTQDNSRKTIQDTLSNKQISDTTIHISFPKGSTWVTVSGKMKGMNYPITVYIPVKQGKQLTAMILPEDSTANIRINQIFTPAGKADGPFGRELIRTLHEQGTYKLILGENMMRGRRMERKV